MRFDTSMNLRLEQRMKLAPRMIQSMEILQLPALALTERIDQELNENPVLEMSEPDPEAADETPTLRASSSHSSRMSSALSIRHAFFVNCSASSSSRAWPAPKSS